MPALSHAEREDIRRLSAYIAYLVDSSRRLLEFVSLKDLIIAGRNVRVEDIMQKEVIFVLDTDDQEEAARKIQNNPGIYRR